MSPIEIRILRLRLEISKINKLKSRYEFASLTPNIEKFRSVLLEELDTEKDLTEKEIEILSVILSELNSKEIKSLEDGMRPTVRLEKLDGIIDGEEQFEAFIFDHVVERGSFEQCQKTLRLNGEFITRNSIYSKNKVDSSEVTR